MNGLTITVEGEPGRDGKSKVVLRYANLAPFSDRLNVDDDFERTRYRDKVVKKLLPILRSRGVQADTHGMCVPGVDELELELQQAVYQCLMDAIEVATTNERFTWQPVVKLASAVPPTTAEWVWNHWIPACSISVLDGDPGLGKSQQTIDLIARISRGDCMPPQSAPDGTFTQESAMLTNGEDDEARVIIPRLIAAKAVMNRVHLFRTMGAGEDERQLTLPSDLPAIEAYIVEHKIRLWVIDPFVMFLDSQISVNNDADVRRCLGQLAAMAERTGVAVLLVRHLNKKSGSHALYRGGGSIGISGAARSVFMVGQDPEDPDSRILASVKSNLCEAPASLRFHIESHGDTSRVVWGESCELHANDLCGQDQKPKANSKQQQAEGIIAEMLANEPRRESEVLSACEAAGISRATYWRARKAIGVDSEKIGFENGWMLSLPATATRYPEFEDAF